MKEKQSNYWQLLAFVLFALLILSGCKVRERSLSTQISNKLNVDSLSQHYTAAKLVTSYYGDVLTGSYNPDSLDGDSAVFESAGIKLTLKKKAKGKGIDFKVKAKPVARSELTRTDSSKTTLKKLEQSSYSEQKNETIKSPHWTNWRPLIFISAIILLVYWAYKK